jgi:hypothetical protein
MDNISEDEILFRMGELPMKTQKPIYFQIGLAFYILPPRNLETLTALTDNCPRSCLNIG